MIRRTPPAGWREACAQAAGQAPFGGLFSEPGVVRAIFGTTVLETTGSSVPTIVDLLPPAAWDEREAHDRFGIEFPGHQPMRPLLDHGATLDTWTVPVGGEGVHQVAVGPIHAGVIESGHFRFHVVGERVLHVDVRLFHKRRGLEAAAAGSTPCGGLPYLARACAACSVANSVAYAQACEAALGRVADPGTARARTLLLELERFYNHLHDIAAICAGTGFAPGNQVFAALKERANRLNQSAFGHRFLFGTVAVGGSPLSLDRERGRELAAEVARIARTAAAAWHDLLFNASFDGRLHGVGVVGHGDAARLGATGPAARAAGLVTDRRLDSPGLDYGGFEPAALERPDGDVAARLEIRARELPATAEIAGRLLAGGLEPAATTAAGPAAAIGVGRVESPRGETRCAVRLARGRLGAVHLRTASYANWPVLAHAVTESLLPDFPLINKSFELCYACVDR